MRLRPRLGRRRNTSKGNATIRIARGSVNPLPSVSLLRVFPLLALALALALGPAPAATQADPPPTELEIWIQDVAVSADGRTLAFPRYERVGEYTDKSWQVWVADRDGGNARLVLP